MKLFRGEARIEGEWVPVDLVQVGLVDDPKPWRIEAPGERFDGWLMSDGDLVEVEAGSLDNVEGCEHTEGATRQPSGLTRCDYCSALQPDPLEGF